MCHPFRLLLTLSTVLAVSSASIAAEAEPVTPSSFETLEPDTLVRIVTPKFVHVGLYKSHTPAVVVVETARGLRQYPIATIEKLEVQSTPIARSVAVGAASGAILGGGTIVGLYYLFQGDCCGGNGELVLNFTAIMSLLGAVSGLIVAPVQDNWQRRAGSATGTRQLGDLKPWTAAITVRGGASHLGALPIDIDDETKLPEEAVADGNAAYEMTILYRHLVPRGLLGFTVLASSYDRLKPQRDESTSLVDDEPMQALGPDFQFELLTGTLRPYIGAGIKYVTSDKSFGEERGTQRSLGIDSVLGVRLHLGNSQFFAEAQVRGIYAPLPLSGITKHKVLLYGFGAGAKF